MLYFGGGEAAQTLGGPTPVRGVAMAIGVAESPDGGVTWRRTDAANPLLRPKAGAQMFVGWPTFGPAAGGGGGEGGGAAATPPPQHVYYHASDVASLGGKFAIGHARIERRAPASGEGDGEARAPRIAALHDDGYVLLPGAAAAADGGGGGFSDAGGVSARCVVAHPTRPHTLLMVYECTDASRTHALALATSDDEGLSWTRHGAVLRPAEKSPAAGTSGGDGGDGGGDGAMGAWDDGAVARPYLVPPAEAGGPARLYYLGRSADGSRQGIGVAESVDAEWTTWRRVAVAVAEPVVE